MRVLLIVAYDGTNYSGFAKNNNVKTIEQELINAVFAVTSEQVEMIGASRTDAGVHARCNVAVFDTDGSIPANKFKNALNTALPDDIKIMESYEVSNGFHPRHCDVRKIYEYTIYNDKIQLPTDRLYSWHIYQNLDIEAMRKAAEYLSGRHDFSSFCSSNGNDIKDKTRCIHAITVNRAWNYIKIKVIGDGFLYNMVRIITGTLVDVGLGKIKAEEVKDILAAKDRTRAGRTAPAHGLSLLRIEYL